MEALMKSAEVQLNEALEQNRLKDVLIHELRETVKQLQVALAKCERDSILKASRLPEPCVKPISDAFAKSIDNAGLKQAINAELRYISECVQRANLTNNQPAIAKITAPNSRSSPRP
jgi:hypothetical protein